MENKTTPIIKTQDLSFLNMIAYPDILIMPGQTTFIKGESGAGKSTLLKLFSALISPSAGKIYYDNDDIENMDTIELRKQVMMIPQSFYLFDGTVRDNFNEYYRFRQQDMISDDLIKKYLKICMMENDIDADTVSMSGGERQRVFIAICLSFLPRVIMLDEPTSALDSSNAYNMLLNINKFCDENNMTMLVVSHDDKLSDDFAKQTIVLNGRDA